MSNRQVPETPRVISPSPTPSEQGQKDNYFSNRGNRKTSAGAVEPIEETDQLEEDADLARARPRSRSPKIVRKGTREIMNGGVGSSSSRGEAAGVTTQAKTNMPSASAGGASMAQRRKKPSDIQRPPNGDQPAPNGFLSPASAYPQGYGSSYWRNLSRSPSPLGLIPIHREWRAFVHKHEVPRKILHVSIGFLTLYLYYAGWQPTEIHPILLRALIPIFTLDVLRFRWPAFNRAYIRVVGAFMRESEAHDRYNGVISYLAGLWVTMRFCRKDVAIMSVLLLSWCDTAASTVGRWLGRYTPRVRKGKSLAGSLAAFAVGVATAVMFWGFIAPTGTGRGMNSGANAFAFEGTLTVPPRAREVLGLSASQGTIGGPMALAVLSLLSGLAASVSEAIDILGLDDNLTIPILCGIELGACLWGLGVNQGVA
ncbi:phosphatidate cytidylyltransferase [Hortaea werneckii]|nr:phosphatidate cytidylyltransferase [Hortaea werneckii]